MSNITKADFARMVMADNGQALTTSIKVAEYFGKSHSTVLRKIRSMQCSHHFRLRNFAETFNERPNPKGGRPIKSPMFTMTKDGFIFLAFGFTGREADYIKEMYIEAFNWMAERLLSYEFRRNDVMAKYTAEQVTGSMCGRGLNRWKYVKRDLEDEIDVIEQEGQLTIPFLDYQRVASNEEAA